MSSQPERLPAAARRDQILDAAMPLAEVLGFTGVSRAAVAEVLGIHETLVSYYWTPAETFHAAIMERAVATGNLRVLTQGLVARHPVALAAPSGLRRMAAASLISTETYDMLTENDLLNIELRNRGHEDVAALIQEIKHLRDECARQHGQIIGFDELYAEQKDRIAKLQIEVRDLRGELFAARTL